MNVTIPTTITEWGQRLTCEKCFLWQLLLIATGVVRTSLFKGIIWILKLLWWHCFWVVRHNKPKSTLATLPKKPWIMSLGQKLGGLPSSSGKSLWWLVTHGGLVPGVSPHPQAGLQGALATSSLRRDAQACLSASQYSNSSVLSCTHLQSGPFSGLASGKL